MPPHIVQLCATHCPPTWRPRHKQNRCPFWLNNDPIVVDHTADPGPPFDCWPVVNAGPSLQPTDSIPSLSSSFTSHYGHYYFDFYTHLFYIPRRNILYLSSRQLALFVISYNLIVFLTHFKGVPKTLPKKYSREDKQFVKLYIAKTKERFQTLKKNLNTY